MNTQQGKHIEKQENFPHPFVCVDCVIFGFDNNELKLLLLRRANEPFKGKWALPGGFINKHDADADATARFKLKDKTGLENVYMEQFHTFSARKRDPRWVVSIAYFALIRIADYIAKAGKNAIDTMWWSVNDLPPLAFDHKAIIERALLQLKRKIRYQPIGFELLPERFTMPELHKLYETVLQQKLDRRNFRRKILSYNGLLKKHDVPRGGAPHRTPDLYSFDRERYFELTASGFNFEI